MENYLLNYLPMHSETTYTLTELTNGLDVTIKGDANCRISGVSTIQNAQPGQIAFLTNAHYRKYLPHTQASAVILSADDANECTVNAIISRNPYFTYAQIAGRFAAATKSLQNGIHSTVIIDTDCHIDPTVSIGPHCTIGKRVSIAANVQIGPGCVIGDDVMIAENAHLAANVTIYHHVKIGKRSQIASGVVIGCDGFGFANQGGVWHKVPQLGGVVIGDDVDIGANTSIDRGAIEDTIIENGVKLDNLIQVGHNTRIGENTIIAGCVAIAGSTIIGKNCMIGGATCFAGHLHVCDGVIITGMTAVTKSITERGIYSSGIVGAVPNLEFRKNNARFHRLENLMEKVKELESIVKMMTKREDA